LSEQSAAVKQGQSYLSNEDKRRGIVRTVTIERTVRAKCLYDQKKELYAVGVSRIDAHHNRPELVGKLRRVFIKVARLLSSDYSLVTTLEENTEPDSTINDEITNDLARPASCEKHDAHDASCSGSVAESLADAGLESVPGL
jgi:hypothetical protein